MNYLAHAYLSFNNSHLLVGNMIADYVKGKTQFDYPAPILAGIKLHRAIDEYTDNHQATHQIKLLFKPAYRLYAGAFVDIVYDYFLANDTTQFENKIALQNFTQNVYQTLQANTTHMPEKFAKIFPYMVTQNWLFNYSTDEGMQKSFAGLARRALYINETGTAYAIFLENKSAIRKLYNMFFEDLKKFAIYKAETLLHN